MRAIHRTSRAGFSLTEMLVALGIILVLLGLLLPMIIRAQRAAKVTQCQAKLREIGAAVAHYLSDFGDYLPPGGSSNSMASPGSPRSIGTMPEAAALVYPPAGSDPGRRFWPEELFGDARSVGPPGYADYRIPPLAYFLQRYIPPSKGAWACPAASRNAFGMTALPPEGEDASLYGALAGHQADDGFVSGYRYMGTADVWFGLHSSRPEFNWIPPIPGPNVAKCSMWHIYLSRNIGGLKVESIKPVSPASPAEIVVCFDAVFTAHNSEVGGFQHTLQNWQPDVTKWTPNPDISDPAMGRWSANFLYLDGHVEKKPFESKARFVRLLHAQVPQRWGYLQLLDRTAMEYPWEAFGKLPVR